MKWMITGLLIAIGTTGFAKTHFIEKLDLSRDQMTQIKAIRADNMDHKKQLKENMRTSWRALHMEMAKPTPNMARINQLKQEITAYHGQLLDHRVMMMRETRRILTPAQREELQKRVTEHREKRAKTRRHRVAW